MKKILVILALLLPSTALADYSVAAGALLQCFPVAVSDSSSTTGAGLTGLVYNSASLACSYYRQNQGTSATSITLVTSTLGTHPGATSGGFIAIDGTKQPGEYEFCVPNAALASAGGVNWANFECHGATNMAPMRMRVSLLSPNTYGYDGTLASVSGTSVGLATAAIDATNQFAYTAELAVFDTAGLLEAVSCITASNATTEVVTTAEDISALITVGHNYLVRANSACRALRSTTAGITIDVAATGEAGLDFSNVNGTLDAAEIGTDAITAAKIATDAIGASEIAADSIGASELQTDAIGSLEIANNAIDSSEIATDSIGSAQIAAAAIGTSEFAAEADINAEMLDVLNVDTFAEPAACPTATASLQAKISFLAALARNKLTQTATTFTLRNDADSASICASTTSDTGSLFTRGELN